MCVSDNTKLSSSKGRIKKNVEARVYKKKANKLIVAEERSKLLKGIIAKKVGFKEEEDFILEKSYVGV